MTLRLAAVFAGLGFLSACSLSHHRWNQDPLWLSLQTLVDGKDRGVATKASETQLHWLRDQHWAQELPECHPLSSEDESVIALRVCCPAGDRVSIYFRRDCPSGEPECDRLTLDGVREMQAGVWTETFNEGQPVKNVKSARETSQKVLDYYHKECPPGGSQPTQPASPSSKP